LTSEGPQAAETTSEPPALTQAIADANLDAVLDHEDEKVQSEARGEANQVQR